MPLCSSCAGQGLRSGEGAPSPAPFQLWTPSALPTAVPVLCSGKCAEFYEFKSTS